MSIYWNSGPWLARNRPWVAGLLLGLFGAAGCAPEGPAVEPAESTAVHAALVEKAVLPALGELSVAARALARDAAALCRAPDPATLGAARDAWRASYLAWRRAGPFLFGPGDDLGAERRIGVWPAHTQVLDATVQPGAVREVRADPGVRGFAAAEYLLFAPDDPAAATAHERCEHLQDVVGEIASLTGDLEGQWRAGYGARVAAAGAAGTGSEPLALALAQALNLTENLLWQRIGLPSGFFRGTPRPDLVEAPYGQVSAAGLAASLDGLRRLLLGGEGPGVLGLVAARDPALAARVAGALDRLEAEAARIRDPLGEAIVADKRRLQRLYDEIQELQNLLRDLVKTLGLQVLLTEDGD